MGGGVPLFVHRFPPEDLYVIRFDLGVISTQAIIKTMDMDEIVRKSTDFKIRK